MGRGVSVSEKEYLYIKELLSKGLKTEEIAKKTGRSLDTIRTINYSDDYDDFIKTPTKELRKRRKNLKNLMAQNEQKANELLERFEQVAMPNPFHCIESAYLFLRDECQNVQISNGLLTVTMEVSKWESLF